MAKVPRSQNSHADSLATLALSSNECVPRMIFVKLLEQPSIEHCPVVASASSFEPSWMDPYVSFLTDGSLLTDTKEVEKMRRTLARLWLFEDKKLYRKSFEGPYLL